MKQLISPLALAMLTLLIVGVLAPPASSYEPMNARSVALGGNGAIGALGAEAIGQNPAMMGLSGQPRYSLLVPGLNGGLRLANSELTMQQVAETFNNGHYLTEADKRELYGNLSSERWRWYEAVYLPVLAFTFPTKYLNMGFSVETAASSDWQVQREFAQFALFGHGRDQFGQQREFKDTWMRGQSVSRISLTIAKPFQSVREFELFDELAAGATFGYLIGHGYSSVNYAGASLFTDVDSLSGRGAVETVNIGTTGYPGEEEPFAPGSGVSMDLGLSARFLNKRLTVGFTVQNLISELSYTEAHHRVYSYELEQPLAITGLDGGNAWVDSSFTLEDTLAAESDPITELPRVVRLHAGYYATERLQIVSEVRAGLNSTPGGDEVFRFGLGAEYLFKRWLPLRGGFSVGGRGAFHYGGGFGLRYGPLRFDLAGAYENGFGTGAKGFQAAATTALFFR